jgi:F0F1-type ATP synthase epsilon subunit
MTNLKPIKVIVRNTQGIIFNDDVDRISSFNEVGRFDVFPMHANFISIIRQELILYRKNEKIKELKVEQAVMKVKQDVVHIFLGIEMLYVEEEQINNPQITTK